MQKKEIQETKTEIEKKQELGKQEEKSSKETKLEEKRELEKRRQKREERKKEKFEARVKKYEARIKNKKKTIVKVRQKKVFLTATMACSYLGINTKTLKRWVDLGLLKEKIMKNNHKRYNIRQLRKLLADEHLSVQLPSTQARILPSAPVVSPRRRPGRPRKSKEIPEDEREV